MGTTTALINEYHEQHFNNYTSTRFCEDNKYIRFGITLSLVVHKSQAPFIWSRSGGGEGEGALAI